MYVRLVLLITYNNKEKFLELNMVRDTFIRDHGRASLEINKEDNEQGHQVWSAVVTESCAASVTISRH